MNQALSPPKSKQNLVTKPDQEEEKKLTAFENEIIMNRFAELVRTLGAATKTNDKLDALVELF